MNEFDKRETAAEEAFARSETLRFKALSRRNRALGLWAAETLGLSGEAAKAYVEALAKAEIEGIDDERLIERLHDDFAKAGVDLSTHRIRRRMEEELAKATAELRAGR